jgi:hypothetical protein
MRSTYPGPGHRASYRGAGQAGQQGGADGLPEYDDRVGSAGRGNQGFGARPGCERRLPGQLDLKLGAVIFDLKFHFQMHLIGDVGHEPEVPAFDDDIVVGGKLVSDRMQACSRRLRADGCCVSLRWGGVKRLSNRPGRPCDDDLG